MGLARWSFAVADPHTLKLARISQSFQLATAIVLAPILFLICQRLPVRFGWENGPVETTQAIMLAVAGILSLCMAYVRRGHVQRYFWLAALLVWLILLGRELSWGAVFISPSAIDPQSGPLLSSRYLSYKPLVPYVGGAVALLAAALCGWAQPRGMLRHAMIRKGLLPWGSLLGAMMYALIVVYAENGQKTVAGIPQNAQVVEEVFETVTYYFLIRFQWAGFSRWLK